MVSVLMFSSPISSNDTDCRWHNRETQKAMGLNGMPHKYRRIFYGILESGALYLLAWVSLNLVFLD